MKRGEGPSSSFSLFSLSSPSPSLPLPSASASLFVFLFFLFSLFEQLTKDLTLFLSLTLCPSLAAASWNHTTTVDYLLSAGADPTATNKDGKTAAQIARLKGHTALAAKLEAAQHSTRTPTQPEETTATTHSTTSTPHSRQTPLLSLLSLVIVFLSLLSSLGYFLPNHERTNVILSLLSLSLSVCLFVLFQRKLTALVSWRWRWAGRRCCDLRL